MPGPAPQENKRRRNADVYADVQTRVSTTNSIVRGPSLQEATAGTLATFDPPIVALVEDWWETWRSSPVAEAFLDTDWSRLAMVAHLVASYYARPHYTKLSEIRQNESLLGATHVDRLRARIKVERGEAPKEQPAGVTALNDYRSRLSG